MRQAANLNDFETGMDLSGIKINTNPTDFYPIERMQVSQFNGETFLPFGAVLSSKVAACGSYSAASER